MYDFYMLSLDQAKIARQIIGTLMARCADYVREVWDTTYHQSVTYRRYCMSVHRCQDLGMNLMVEAKGGMNTSYIYIPYLSASTLWQRPFCKLQVTKVPCAFLATLSSVHMGDSTYLEMFEG